MRKDEVRFGHKKEKKNHLVFFFKVGDDEWTQNTQNDFLIVDDQKQDEK